MHVKNISNPISNISNISVLVIEDNDLYSQAIRTILETDNISISVISAAENGIDFLEKNKIDIILLDIMMGDNMTGFEFLHILKNDIRFENIPVIILSALVHEEKIYEGLALGAIDYLVKPFRANELILKVKNHTKTNSKIKEEENLSPITYEVLELDYDYQLSIKFATLINKTVVEGSYITVKDVVKKLNTNTSKLDIIVKKYHNTTPVKYILTKRLSRADLILRSTNVSVNNIAVQCGFKSISYFCTAYKKAYGKSPLEARNS